MSSDGLQRVYLIKSAGYEFADIDLSQNTLLLGDSGVGKTTIMRAVLFFYTMDYADNILDINPATKKPFNDWYFRYHNSHVVYEYTKEESRFLLILSKTTKLHYTFVDITNTAVGVKELFIDAKMPVHFEKLQENIQKNNLSNYTTTIKEKYINTLHRRDAEHKKIKQESVTNFSLFESVASRKEFAKTLSHIFASSKVSSHSIKKSIVSLINDAEAKIDLFKIKNNLNNFISDKKQIEKFETKIPIIEALSITYKGYQESRTTFKRVANILESLKKSATIKRQENIVAIQKIDAHIQKQEIEYKVTKREFKKKILVLHDTIVGQKNEIEGLQRKEQEYKAAGIEKLLQEHNEEANYKNQLTNAIRRKEALTSSADELTTKYEKIFTAVAQTMQEDTLKIKEAHRTQVEGIQTQINESILEKEKKINSATHKQTVKKEALQKELEDLQGAFNETKISLARVENFPFNKEEIERYENEIKQFVKELAETTQLLNTNTLNTKMIEREIADLQKMLKEQTAQLSKKIEQEKAALFDQKADLEKKLDFNGENLYGFLHKNDIRQRDKIVAYLKDEILFSPKPFKVTQHAHDSAIFGLEVAFEEEFVNKNSDYLLRQALETVKAKIKQLNKRAAKEQATLDEEAQKVAKEKERQRSALYGDKEKLEKNEKSYKNSIELAKLNLENEKKKTQELRNEKREGLEKIYAEQKSEIDRVTEEKNSIEDGIRKISDDINAMTKKFIGVKKAEINTLQEKTALHVQAREEQAKKEREVFEKELQIALKNEGIDEKALVLISDEIKELEKKLHVIEKSKNFVIVYISEYRDAIQDIPNKQKCLDENSAAKLELEKELQVVTQKYQKSVENLQEQRQKYKEAGQDLEKFLTDYTKKIENRPIEKNIENALSLQNDEVATERYNIKEIVDEIVSLYSDITTAQELIRASVLECSKAIQEDNIFKIDIESDYIDSKSYLKTAKDLIGYVQQNKIAPLKEALLELFKSSINSIKKELDIFDEALFDIESEVTTLRNTINKAVDSFVVIDSIKVRFENSNHSILNMIKDLSSFYHENNDKFLTGIFNFEINESETIKAKEKLYEKIDELIDLLKSSKEYVELEDGFVLEFKVIEKGNDLKWRQTLNDIGSNGTSTLVKSIINIAMLQMVSKNVSSAKNLISHCILDEIGTISTDYFRELKDFVNRSGFAFLNGMPTEDDMLISMYPTIYIGQNRGNYSQMILASKVEA